MSEIRLSPQLKKNHVGRSGRLTAFVITINGLPVPILGNMTLKLLP
jgi:hypothetical protein